MAELRAIETRPAKIQSAVVDMLSDALEKAKAGNVTSLAMVMVLAEGGIETVVSPSDDFYHMLGAVTQLLFNMTAAQRED